jgi:hypothetical protein
LANVCCWAAGGEPTMRNFLLGAVAAVFITAGSMALAETTVSGEYVEARTCNVYIGACHANGERVTAGREALMAWNFRKGAVDGVQVDGLNAVAVTAGSDNLAEATANRTSVIYVDSRATEEQAKAVATLLSSRYDKALGKIAAVKRAPIEFKKDKLEYTVRVPDVAYLKTTRFECSHCVMPHMLWYEPFVELKSSLVAKASMNEFKGAPELGTKWRRADENSSFVGEFAF